LKTIHHQDAVTIHESFCTLVYGKTIYTPVLPPSRTAPGSTTREEFQIRRAVEADAPGILDCLSAAFAVYHECYSEQGFLDTVLTSGTLKHRRKQMVIFVAVRQSDGMVIGTVACGLAGEEEGHLRGMAVLPDCQGAGVAQQLLERAETELRARKCTRVTLDTTEPLRRAIRFYERHGYRPSGKVSDFFGMPLYEYVKDLRGRTVIIPRQ
jgi:ribosomal protein S18 acetylase RimI-like enzyme